MPRFIVYALIAPSHAQLSSYALSAHHILSLVVYALIAPSHAQASWVNIFNCFYIGGNGNVFFL